MTITVKDDDAAFEWVKEWFLEQKFMKRVRRVDLDTTLRGAEMALIPAPGTHFFWHQRRPFWVRFVRSEDIKGRSQRRIESLTFQTLGREQLFLKQFTHDERETYPDFGVNTEIYTEGRFQELELLGPQRIVAPGESLTLVERWSLRQTPGASAVARDADQLHTVLAPHLASLLA